MTRRFPCLCLGLALLLSGCGENDPIRTETVPKPPPDTSEAKVRLLAAILENGGEQWFFKLVGPIDEMEKHVEPFAKFVQSVRLTGKADDPIKWDVPASWEAGPKKELRFATFYLGKGKTPELTVSHFDRVSSVLDNVNRWCERDLGRPPLRERELKKVEQKVKAGEHEVTLINLTGPGVKAALPMHAGMPKRPPQALPIEYTTPAGWTETGPRPGFVPVLTAFSVDAPSRTETTVTVMRGMTGDLLENVKRWQGQVNAKVTDRLPDAPTIKVGGADGVYFDIEGDRRMLMVMVKRGIATWYFKLMGNKDVVGKNKGAFEAFVKSVKFNGGVDE